MEQIIETNKIVTKYANYIIGTNDMQLSCGPVGIYFPDPAEVLAMYHDGKLVKPSIYSGIFLNTNYKLLVHLIMSETWNQRVANMLLPTEYLMSLYLRTDDNSYKQIIRNDSMYITLTDSALMDLRKS